jgi:hypothetical protein
VDYNENICFDTATARSDFLIHDLIFLAGYLAAFHRPAFNLRELLVQSFG